MIIAKVLGNVVATQKNHRYESARVMMCEQMTPEGELTGHTILALDAVDAGVGDTVLVVQEGWSASTVATGEAGAAKPSEDAIRAAHRRLIRRTHPDAGGTADLAARINRAKDVLVGG